MLLLLLLLLMRLGVQVVLGSSIDEALQWAQQNLDAPAAQLVKDALALKDQPFSSEWLSQHTGCQPCRQTPTCTCAVCPGGHPCLCD